MSPKLLWADDDVEFTGLCRLFFERHGFQVRTAASGLECLEILHGWEPDLLVVDDRLRWGVTNGVLASLNAAPLLMSAADCRVFLTGENPGRLATQNGAAKSPLCLPKPFQLRAVLQLAESAIAGTTCATCAS